jgi:hypothetical protein
VASFYVSREDAKTLKDSIAGFLWSSSNSIKAGEILAARSMSSSTLSDLLARCIVLPGVSLSTAIDPTL